jgi:hypothetical protein
MVVESGVAFSMFGQSLSAFVEELTLFVSMKPCFAAEIALNLSVAMKFSSPSFVSTEFDDSVVAFRPL